MPRSLRISAAAVKENKFNELLMRAIRGSHPLGGWRRPNPLSGGFVFDSFH
jgi:hypothetical protein